MVQARGNRRLAAALALALAAPAIAADPKAPIAPKPVKPLPDGFTFYGIRNIVLNRAGKSPLFYSATYQGNHAFVRDRDEFDSLIDLDAPGTGRIVRLSEAQAAGLMRGRHQRPLGRARLGHLHRRGLRGRSNLVEPHGSAKAQPFERSGQAVLGKHETFDSRSGVPDCSTGTVSPGLRRHRRAG